FLRKLPSVDSGESQGGCAMKRQAGVAIALAFCCLFFLSSRTASGQAVYGSILGTVTDSQGNAVVGAKVTVTSTTKGTVDEAESNESGNYTVTHLLPDAYRLHVEAPGFKAFDIASIQISADTATKADAQLSVGDVSQTVEVSGEIPQLKTD